MLCSVEYKGNLFYLRKETDWVSLEKTKSIKSRNSGNMRWCTIQWWEMDEIKRRRLKRVYALTVTRAMWVENRIRVYKMMVQLRWKCPPQALLLLILVHGHLFVLLRGSSSYSGWVGPVMFITQTFLDFGKVISCIHYMLYPQWNLEQYPIIKHIYIW